MVRIKGRKAAIARRAASVLTTIILAVLLIGCERTQPYRVSHPDLKTAPVCNPNTDYTIPETCRTSIVEHSKYFDLFFNEFTDQGLQYPKDIYPTAGAQIDDTLAGLKEIAADKQYKGISIVLFVHGWKHNASHDDSNVKAFRALLQSTAALEEASGSRYRVVGVYVGWRGLSVIGEPLADISFWARKNAALRVAQGSPRELFNRLRSFKCAQNHPEDGGQKEVGAITSCDTPPSDAPRTPKVRVLMIGHSFGAWILYNAVAGSLVESLTHADDTGGPTNVNTRFADMIILLNPAFEAIRYTPLHRIATDPNAQYTQYQAPLLVSVTTEADWATGKAFPVGRFINTILEREIGHDEKIATVRTMGHVPDYITHELTKPADSIGRPEVCANWKRLADITDATERTRQAEVNRQAEKANADAFLGTRRSLETGWTRSFCGGEVLRHTQYSPNSVIWNVHTDSTIMTGHNDIENPALLDFVRQLYHDTLLYPRLGEPKVMSRLPHAPPASAGPTPTSPQ